MKTLTCMRKSTSSRRRQDLGLHSLRSRLCTKTPPWWPENRRVGRHGQLRFGCNRFKLNFFEKACFFTRLLVIADEKQVLPKFLSLSNSSQIATVLECGVQRLRHLCPPWLGLPAFQLVARLARIPARGSITFSTESFDNG
ncbi:unnamed protein product [Brassica oleracea var. botrytis]